MFSPQGTFTDPDFDYLCLTALKEHYNHSKADLVSETAPLCHESFNIVFLCVAVVQRFQFLNYLTHSLMHDEMCVCVYVCLVCGRVGVRL